MCKTSTIVTVAKAGKDSQHSQYNPRQSIQLQRKHGTKKQVHSFGKKVSFQRKEILLRHLSRYCSTFRYSIAQRITVEDYKTLTGKHTR